MNIQKMIQSAKEYFQSGQFEKAEQRCKRNILFRTLQHRRLTYSW